MKYVEIIISSTICLFIFNGSVSLAAPGIDTKASLCGNTHILLKAPQQKVTKIFSDATCEPNFEIKGWVCEQHANFDRIMAVILDTQILIRQMDTWNQALELAQGNKLFPAKIKIKAVLASNLTTTGRNLFQKKLKGGSLDNLLHFLDLKLNAAQKKYTPLKGDPEKLFPVSSNSTFGDQLIPKQKRIVDGGDNLGVETVYELSGCLDSQRIMAISKALYSILDKAETTHATLLKRINSIDIDNAIDNDPVLQGIEHKGLI